MQAAQQIRAAMAGVAQQREVLEQDSGLRSAVSRIKGLQASRFASTYADLLRTAPFDRPAQFFLQELYGDRDFSQRDLQFSRIAGALQRLFPAEVAQTAVALAQLHALTEQLDFSMGQSWLCCETAASGGDAWRYLQAWRGVDRRADRNGQLRAVVALGRKLGQLTRTPGLRTMLRLMRGPATAAGLTDLQHFLETGFDNFSALSRVEGRVDEFLQIVQQRETEWLGRLFDADPVTCETTLARALGQVRESKTP